jgi:glycosyltransferase involved in cell wall biosynthesis
LSDSVIVTGIVDGVRDYLSACDVFVLPSYREGMPRALLEAMSMGLAVVATDIRGCREAIVHGYSGLLYPAHDIECLRRLLEGLIADPARRVELGRVARETALSRFDEAPYVRRQIEVIERLLEQAGLVGHPETDAGTEAVASSS